LLDSLLQEMTMLRNKIFDLCHLQKRGLKLYSANFANKKEFLKNFESMPDFGNSNTNPLKHHNSVQNIDPKKNGKKLCIAILGVPNSGKSTLINKLMGKEVCPSSCKHNTTRHNARAILTQDDTQIVFLDTPGVVDPKDVSKYKLEPSLVRDPEMSCKEADLLLVLQDVSNRFVREAVDKKILRLLCKHQHRVPSILVLNKLDAIPRNRRLYDLIRKLTCNRLDVGTTQIKISEHDPKWNVESYLKRLKRISNQGGAESKKDEDMSAIVVLEEARQGKVKDDRAETLITGLLGWPGFRDVFSISAKDGSGVEDLKNYLFKSAIPGGHRFSPDILVDVDPRESVVNIIKSKLLEHLEHDVPYGLKPEIEHWQYEEETALLRISVSIATKNRRESASLIGENGRRIRLIAMDVENVLEDFFDYNVKLTLVPVLHKKNTPAEPNKPALGTNATYL